MQQFFGCFRLWWMDNVQEKHSHQSCGEFTSSLLKIHVTLLLLFLAKDFVSQDLGLLMTFLLADIEIQIVLVNLKHKSKL